jgi:putative FmdB family regulatory protein
MPIFEYACLECGARFEKLLVGQQAVSSCPACGASDLERLHSSFACHAHSTPVRPCERPGFSAGQCDPGTCGCAT